MGVDLYYAANLLEFLALLVAVFDGLQAAVQVVHLLHQKFLRITDFEDQLLW